MSDVDLSAATAIGRLLSDFAWYADRRDAMALAELFLPDGVLCVGGKEFHGREAILEDCRRRFLSERKTRHVWSNLRIDAVDGGALRADAVQLTYEQERPEEPTELRINDLSDLVRRDEAGRWRFARRVVSRQLSLSI